MYNSGENRGILYRNDGTNPNPATPPTANSLQSVLPQLQFVGTMATCRSVIGLHTNVTSYTTATVNWNGVDNITAYEYAVTNSATPPTAWQTTTATSLNLTDLTRETHYYFHIRSKCGETSTSMTLVYPFYTGYCIPTGYSNNYRINGVKITGGYTEIDNLDNGTANAYSNFSEMKVSQRAGEVINYAVNRPSYTGLKIWIDFNQDMIFDDSELVASHTTNQSTGNITGSVTIPADLPLGDYRIRIRSQNYTSSNSACGENSSSYGEAEDYTLSVVEEQDCLTPTALTAQLINASDVKLSWTSTATLFDVELINLTSGERLTGTPTHAGVANQLNIANLEASTQYGYAVRTVCGEGDVSLWQGPFLFRTHDILPSPWREEFQALPEIPLGWGATADTDLNGYTFDSETENSLAVYLYDTWWGGQYTGSISTINVGPILHEDTFSFKYAFMDTDTEDTLDAGVANIKIFISTDFGQTYQLLTTITNNDQSNWQTYTKDMTSYAGQYVKIKVETNLIEDYYSMLAIFDDFDISGGIPCYEIEDASVDVLNSNGPTLTIESQATNFDVEYGFEGFELGEGTEATAITSPYLIPELMADTTYDIYIRGQYCEEWYGPVTFTVNAAETQDITVEDTTKAYGDEPFIVGTATSELPLTYTVEDLGVAKFEDGKLVITGAGVTQVTAHQEGNGLFLPAEDETFTLTVTPAELMVTADADQKKFYGDTDSVFTYTATGFKYADTVTVFSGALEREEGEDVGTYAINQGLLVSNDNYTIAYTSADYTILHAKLTVNAEPLVKVYGQADPALTFVASGFKNNDTVESLITGGLVREAGENVGRYSINKGSLALNNPNYTLLFNASQLVIDPALLSVYPSATMGKVYGQDDPVLTFEITGFQFNDTRAMITGTIERTGRNNVGEYPYTTGTLASNPANYIYQIANQEKFKITPAPVQAIATANQQKAYGQADPVLTFTAEGLQYNDVALTAFTGQLKRNPGEDVGLYPIMQGTLAPRPNYYLTTFTGADFEIVNGNIQGLTLPSATYVYDGTAKSLVVQGTVSEDAMITYTNNNQTNVGVYTVTAVVDYGSSYNPITLEGELTITKADQSISFNAPSQVVLEETPSLQLSARANSNLSVSYSIDNPAEADIATVDAAGVIHFLQPGFVTVTAHQEGNENYNPAVSVNKTIEIISKNASILNLIIDGVSQGKVEKEVYVIIGCEHPQEIVVLDVETEEGAIVKPGNHIEVAVPTYGIYEQLITVISAYGNEDTYKVIIDKRMPAELIVHQKYDNVLLVNNNKETNGGYVFNTYEWFKDGVSVGKKQFYSAGKEASNTLDAGSTYYVVVTLNNGKTITSCPIVIEAKTETPLAISPNPVKKNQVLNIKADNIEQEVTSYVIYNVKGQVMKRGEMQRGMMQVEIPSTMASGSYYLQMELEGKSRTVQFIVKE